MTLKDKIEIGISISMLLVLIVVGAIVVTTTLKKADCTEICKKQCEESLQFCNRRGGK
jgi:hypothetical protein